MLLAIQFLGFCLIITALLAGAGWWQLAVSWWESGTVPMDRQSRTVVMLTRNGLYFGRERYSYAYAHA